MPAVDQAGRLAGAGHRDGHHAEFAAVQPDAAAKAGDVAGPVRVVADEERLRPVDLRTVRQGGQPGAAVALQQVGQQLQRRAELVAAVGGIIDDFGVGAERRVVDEGPVADHAEVDAQFDGIAQRAKAGGRVFPVEPEVEREVVAGARRDHHEREVVLRRDRGDQRLRAVAAGDAEQVGAAGDGRARHRGDVDGPGTVEQEHLGAEVLGLPFEVESADLSVA